MNAADLAIPLDGGGTEPQFHGGGMVDADMEPAAVIEECLKSASGLIAEVGGIYKVRAGAPGVPVMSFTDEDIIVTKEQGYRPFVGMEDTYNIVNATYTERGERWARKEAPQLRDGDMIDEDDGRELPIGIDYPTVHSNTTVQRLIQTALRNARRFRTHVHYLPPQAWLLEPLDVVAWTSARNGYAAKDFDIEEIEGGSNFLQMVRLRENDPGDYDWNPETDEQPWSVATLETIRPAPQPMTGWQAVPATIRDSENNARRPSIEVSYASGLEDVMAVRVQVRLKATEAVVFDGEVPYAPPYAVTLNGVFLPNETYEVRGRYVPYSTRLTEWSAWIEVTTPDIKFTSLDVELDEIANEIGEQVAELTDWATHNTRETIERLRSNVLEDALGAANAYTDRQKIRREVLSISGQNRAEWTEAIDVATGPGSAIVTRIEELRAEVFDEDTGLPATASALNILAAEVHDPDTGLEAVGNAILSLDSLVGNNASSALLRLESMAAPSGSSARASLSVGAGVTGAVTSSALYLDARNDGTSEAVLVGGRVSLVAGPSGAKQNLLVVDGSAVWIDNARIRNLTAGNIQAGSLDASVIDVGDIFAQNASITGTLRVAPAPTGPGISIQGPQNRILISD